MGILENANAIPTAAAAADFYDYQIPYSCRFDKASSAYLTTANLSGVTTNSQFTASFWVKRSSLDTSGQQPVIGNSDGAGQLEFRTDFTFTWGSYGTIRNANRVFRDTGAWAHFYIYRSTSDGGGSIYVNGVQETLTADTAGSSGIFRDGKKIQVGASNDGGALFGGYIAEVHLFYDQNIAHTEFGEFKNGVWIPKEYTGSYGSAYDFYLKFEDASNLGNDSSGNDNDFTIINLTSDDQMLDSPTFNSSSNGGNFATLNPLAGSPDNILTEGNLKATKETGSHYEDTPATMNLKGKYYVECCAKELMADPGQAVGLVNIAEELIQNRDGRLGDTGVSYRRDGQLHTAGSSASFGTAWTADDIVQMAVDMTDIDSVKVWFGLNNTWQNSGDPSAGTNIAATITNGEQIMAMSAGYSGTGELIFNFGADGTFAGEKTAGGNSDASGFGNFLYTPPTNFLALCAGNLPTPVADPAGDDAGDGGAGPQNYFSPIVWTGNGATGRAITGLGFQSDFIWFKDRDQAFSNRLYDTTRGITATGGWRLFSNTTGANTDKTSSGQDISAVGSDGFTLGASDANYTNYNTSPEVAWCWRANGGTTSSGSGDLTSTHQVDPTGYFSIVKATGDGGSGDKTISHGLSAAPDCILAKNLDTTYNWDTYFSSGVTAGSGMRLNTDETPFTGRWGTVNSSIFTCVENFTWASTNNYIYYCFANTEGYIKAGSYEGNGDANGTFVYTGFRPAWIMTKSVDSTSDWLIFDNKRLGYNVDNNSLEANDSAGAATTDMIDILSNGFKLRIATDPNVAETYVYLAMAHNPFKYATAR